jgi:hypothetical protein
MKCFACGRPLKPTTGKIYLANCSDEQTVYVGSDCMQKIVAAGEKGYQPAGGGPRLYKSDSKDGTNGRL